MIENISINSLRVFQEVFEKKSMSLASKSLFMTQPGVSQHIKTMEELLETKLFDRIGKKLLATDEAVKLYPEIKSSLDNMEKALFECSSLKRKLTGHIKIGLPIEIGNNLVLSKVAKWAKEHPAVTLEFNYDHILRQAPLIISGELDFAVTDSYTYPKEINSQTLFNENLVLISSREYAKENDLEEDTHLKQLEKQKFIRYLPDAPIINQWFEFHYKKRPDLNFRVTLMDVRGVLRSVSEGLGIGVVPLHVLKQSRIKNIIIFKGSGKVLKNKISLVHLKDRTLSAQAKSLINSLYENF